MPGGIIDAMSAASELDAVLMLLLGMALGAVTGFIPGLSGVTGMAIFLPFTVGMDPFPALMFFAGLGGAPRFTGAVTSIVLNIPGSPVNAATAFDGYPMARRGEAGRALSIAATSSLLGTVFGMVVLLAAMPVVFSLLNVIGPAELFALAVLALTTISFSSTNTLQGFVRGLASGGLGLLVAFIGVATVTGRPRFNFGSDGYLFDGIQLVPLFIGVFAVAQVMRFAIDRDPSVAGAAEGGRSGVLQGVRDTFQHWRILLRGSTIGAAIGAMPGVGGTAANFLSYSWTKATSREPDRYGTGIPEGVIATEGANNAEHSASIVPTLSFGIPGSAEGALVLGLLTLQGYITGPLLLVNHPDVLWVLVIGTVVSVLVISLLGLASTGALAKVTLLPLRYLVPGVLVSALLGTYVAGTNVWDLVMAVGIGLIGFWFIASGFSPASLVIGYVLGRLTEDSFVLAYQSGGGSYAALFTRPAALVIWVAVIALTLLAARSAARGRQQRRERSALDGAAVPGPGVTPSWGALGFTVLALGFTLTLLAQAGELPTRVGLVPRAIGWPTALLLLLSVGLELARLRSTGWQRPATSVGTWPVFVVLWTASYVVAIVFLGFTLASVLAAGIYVAVEGVTGAVRVPARRLLARVATTSAAVAVVLLVLDGAALGGFDGLLFDASLPPW